LASSAFPRVALYFENSILKPDLPLLATAGGIVSRVEKNGSGLAIESPRGIGVVWNGPALVDGKSWPLADGATVWLPPGAHTLGPAAPNSAPRVIDFNGDLRSAERVGPSGVELSYESSARALAL